MIKRWLITFGVAWLLGCVVTVLVAWCCTVRGGSDGEFQACDTPTWPGPTPKGWTMPPYDSEQFINSSIFGGIDFAVASGIDNDRGMGLRIERARMGWPFRALRTTRYLREEWIDDEPVIAVSETPGIVQLPHRISSSLFAEPLPLRLPIMPVWTGFMANSTITCGLIALLYRLFQIVACRRNGAGAKLSWKGPARFALAMAVAGVLASLVGALGIFAWMALDRWNRLEYRGTWYRAAAQPDFRGEPIDSLSWPGTPPLGWPQLPGLLRGPSCWYGVWEWDYVHDPYDTIHGGSPSIEYEMHTAIIRQYGWPMPCVEGVSFVECLTASSWKRTPGPWTIEIPLGTTDSNPHAESAMVPLRPIWLGLVANTLFYAYVIALPMLSVRAVRVVRRRRRGACESCGYSRAGLAASAACPECGAAITARG